MDNIGKFIAHTIFAIVILIGVIFAFIFGGALLAVCGVILYGCFAILAGFWWIIGPILLVVTILAVISGIMSLFDGNGNSNQNVSNNSNMSNNSNSLLNYMSKNNNSLSDFDIGSGLDNLINDNAPKNKYEQFYDTTNPDIYQAIKKNKENN